MSTIRDLAKLANVSVPTVSRVLNGHPVDDAMAERVRKAVRDLNYVPNRSARRLRGAGTRLIGAIFSDISNPFYTQLLRAVEMEMAAIDATLIVANSDSDPKREARLLQIMREEGVAGLVIAPAGEDPGTLAGAVHAGFPIVVVDRIMRDLEVDTVHSRNFDATVSAVAHLVKVGHQKIGFIGGPHRLSSARDRYSGFLCGLSDAGIAHRPDHAVFGNFRMESGRELVSDLLKLPDPPTAVLVANNEMVIGALNHIHSVGLNIPRDIAVVGFDDFPWSISLNPPLTTIAQPVEEIGRTAARLLMERLAFPTRPCRTVTLEARLVVRSSCGAPMAQSAEFQSRSQHGSNANED